MGILQTIGRLQGFLSPRNLELLDVIFAGLTEVDKPPFNPFWVWFGQVRGQEDMEYSIGCLMELRAILKAYRGVQE